MKPRNPSEWLLILILAMINFTHMMDFVIVVPLGPQFMRVFGLNPAEFSIVVSSYTFSAAISGLASAFFIDRFDRKSALLWLYAGFLVGTLLCALAPNYLALVGARVVAGAFGGVVNSLLFSILGDSIPEERRGAATGVVMSAFSVASVVGIPLGLWLAVKFDWHSPFIMLTLVGLVVWTTMLFGLGNMRRHIVESTGPRVWGNFIDILRERNHWNAFILSICLMMGGFTLYPFIGPYLVKNAGLSESELPLVYLCGGIVTFGSQRFIGVLSDRHGKHRIFSVMALLSIPGILLMTNMPAWHLAIILTITTFFMVLMSGRFVPAMSLITSSTTAQKRGGFMSMNASIQHTTAGLASLISGAIVGTAASGQLTRYDWVGFLACGFTLVSVWAARRIKIVQNAPIKVAI